MGNPAAVWKRLTDEEPLDLELDSSEPPKRRKRRLNSDEYEELRVNYWSRRRADAHDREAFVEAAMDWCVYAFLFENGDHGKGRNHEIVANADTISLLKKLDNSCDQMVHDVTNRIEMRSVCWWDLQEHCHNLVYKQINRLAEDLFDSLLSEAIERLKASGFLYWHSGVWNLSAKMSRPYILRMKRRGTVFLAPPPSKLAGEYAA